MKIKKHCLESRNEHLEFSQEKCLNHEMLRIQVFEKKKQVLGIFEKNKKQLCDFFIHYQPLPLTSFKMKELFTKQVRLIKNDHKVYFGGIQKTKRHGLGILISKEGKIYQGLFNQGVREGFGMEIYENGNIYIGQFQNNKKHGKGQFYWFNIFQKSKFCQYYNGAWWGGLPDGSGSHQKKTGDIYEGQFKNGLKHGKGEQYFFNGDSYRGNYVNGVPEGMGEYFWENGSYYEGQFLQGMRNGTGFWKSQNGLEEYTGSYEMDKKCGYGQFKWKKGAYSYKGHFQNDLRHGFGELYYRNDLEYSGQWEKGEKKQHKISNNKVKNSRFRNSTSFKKKKEKTFCDNIQLLPPSSAIKNRMPFNIQQSSSSFTRNKTLNRNSLLLQSRSSSKKRNCTRTSASERESLGKEQSRMRSKSKIGGQTQPVYELLIKKCRKRNCGCNVSIPLGGSVHLRSRIFKTEPKLQNNYF